MLLPLLFTPVLSLNSPYSLLLQIQPNYSKLKIFGSLCFPWLRPHRNHKLETRLTQCVFLGYSLTQSAYLCYDPTSKRLYDSRHVRFVEDNFPFLSLTNSSSSSPAVSITDWTPPATLVPSIQRPLVSPLPQQPTGSDQIPSSASPPLSPMEQAYPQLYLAPQIQTNPNIPNQAH